LATQIFGLATTLVETGKGGTFMVGPRRHLALLRH